PVIHDDARALQWRPADLPGVVAGVVDPFVWDPDDDEDLALWDAVDNFVDGATAPGADGFLLMFQYGVSASWPSLTATGWQPAPSVTWHRGLYHLAAWATEAFTERLQSVLRAHGWRDAASAGSNDEPPVTLLQPVVGGSREQTPLFDVYLAADYSGAADPKLQREHICLSEWQAVETAPRETLDGFTRARLREHLLERLREETRQGRRVLVGIDHQFGLPDSMLGCAGVDGLPWREAVSTLVRGDARLPPLAHPSEYAPAFNRAVGVDVFHSPMKSPVFGLPRRPSPSFARAFRLTERSLHRLRYHPKSAHELGVKGAVAGQTLTGLVELSRLLDEAREEGLPVAVWPFDGLSLNDPAYDGRHVLVEVYPTLLRPAHVPQTDRHDAESCVAAFRHHDACGTLVRAMDLSAFAPWERLIRREGWVFGLVPAVGSRTGAVTPAQNETGAAAGVDGELSLTAEQEAVVDCEAPLVRVVARAGSGKTTTMVRRAQRILTGDASNRVVLLTFTRKAADHLLSRTREAGLDASRLEARTFHGFALDRLLSWPHPIRLPDGLVWQRDRLRLLNEFGRGAALDFARRTVLRDLPLTEKWQDELSRRVNKVDPAGRPDVTPGNLLDRVGTTWSTAWRRLLAFHAEHGLLDFDLAMVLFEYLLRTDRDFRVHARGAATHWVVDEFQDTNHPQLRSLQALAGHLDPDDDPARQVVVVGDDFQTIYEWRGAVLCIFDLFRDWNPAACRTLPLSTNFRSGPAVLRVVNRRADRLGEEPLHRPLCELVGARLRLGRPELGGGAREGTDVVEEVRRLKDLAGRWSDITLLSFQNETAQANHDALKKAGVPVDLVTADPSQTPGVERLLAVVALWCSGGTFDVPLWWYLLRGVVRPEELLDIGREARALMPSEQGRLLAGRLGGALGELVSGLFDAAPSVDALQALTGRLAEHCEDVRANRPACERVATQLSLAFDWPTDPLRVVGEMTRKDFAGTPGTNADAVQVSTIHQYKGLENRAVVVDVDYHPEDPARMRMDYVALSRAACWLVRLHTDSRGVRPTAPFVAARRADAFAGDAGPWQEVRAEKAHVYLTQPLARAPLKRRQLVVEGFPYGPGYRQRVRFLLKGFERTLVMARSICVYRSHQGMFDTQDDFDAVWEAARASPGLRVTVTDIRTLPPD
ncbi:MAG: hypothetical protein RL199_1241, partial [Pseudomonadota bacterium]